MTLSPFLSLHYLSTEALSDLIRRQGPQLLCVVAYGAGRPADLPSSCLFAKAPLQSVDKTPVFEVWTTRHACRITTQGGITIAHNDEVTFGIAPFSEEQGATLEATVEHVYRNIFDGLDPRAAATPIRFWNYLAGITRDENGLERYRRFNMGRHEAFSDRLKLPLPPVASGLGSRDGRSLIYFLAAQTPAQPIENPRQVSAFDYPPLYGPRSPRFSRAGLFSQDGENLLMLSGTASIVGHQTIHQGDLSAQLEVTLENMRLLIAGGESLGFPEGAEDWRIKAYIRHEEDLAAVQRRVEERFPNAQRIYLSADICRPDLLVEIEALCFAGSREGA